MDLPSRGIIRHRSARSRERPHLFLGARGHIEHFARWGYPDWFRLVVGTVETASALLLLVPRTAVLGAAGITVIMAGATYTHLLRAENEAGRAVFTLALLLLAGAVAYLRAPRARGTR